jgi:hypothetical protein
VKSFRKSAPRNSYFLATMRDEKEVVRESHFSLLHLLFERWSKPKISSN